MSWTFDGMKTEMGNNSSIPRQNQVKLFREEVDGHLQLLMLKIDILGCIFCPRPL